MRESLENTSRVRSLRPLALAAVLGLAPLTANASLSCTGPSPSNFTFNSPAGKGVPRDTPVYTRISDFTADQRYGGSTSTWNCTENDVTMVGLHFHNNGTGLPDYYHESRDYKVFPTNVQGVGLIVLMQGMMNGSNFGNSTSFYLPTWYNTGSNGAAPFTATWGFTARFAYVKTGPISGGTVAPMTIGQVDVGEVNGTGSSAAGTHPVNVVFGGGAVFSSLACTTPNVRVDLGSHSAADINASNYSPSTSFKLDLNACPVGINTVQYRLDPATPVVNAAQGMVELDSSSVAGGIAVQVLDDSNNPFPLSVDKYLPGYSASSSGHFEVKLKARYVKTGTIRGGSANSSMTFTMTYL